MASVSFSPILLWSNARGPSSTTCSASVEHLPVRRVRHRWYLPVKDFAVFPEVDRLRRMFCQLGDRIRVVMVELG